MHHGQSDDMTCQRCQGFLVIEEIPGQYLVMTRCVNCGARSEPVFTPSTDVDRQHGAVRKNWR